MQVLQESGEPVMAAKCRRLIPQLEECEHRFVPSTTTAHLAPNYAPPAETHSHTAALGPVNFPNADRGAVVTSEPGQTILTFRARSWARQHARDSSGSQFHIGFNLLSRRWPDQPVQTATVDPIDVGPAPTTELSETEITIDQSDPPSTAHR
jgi:hypothetical protein